MSVSNNAERRDIFAILTGAYGNVGDAVIRREVLGWIRGMGRIHAYVGNATDEWIEQLELSEHDVVYRAAQRREWMWNSIRTSRARLVFDPGEVPLGRHDIVPELGYLMLTIAARARRGVVVRPPRGIGRYSRFTGAVHRLSCRLGSLTYWREAHSASTARIGDLVPDVGFGAKAVGVTTDRRDTVVLSFRAERGGPSPATIRAIVEHARSNALRVIAVSQVKSDESLTERLGKELASLGVGEYLPWGTSTDAEQELKVRTLYSHASLVVSDRMHVLILAALEGAAVCELVDAPVPKISRSFQTIGLNEISKVTVDMTEDSVATFLGLVVDDARERETSVAIERAAARVNSVRDEVRTMLQ